jgi:hypothetical protein
MGKGFSIMSPQLDLASMFPYLLIVFVAALISALGQAFWIRWPSSAERRSVFLFSFFAFGSLLSIFSLLQRLKNGGHITEGLYLFYMAIAVLLSVASAWRAQLRRRPLATGVQPDDERGP